MSVLLTIINGMTVIMIINLIKWEVATWDKQKEIENLNTPLKTENEEALLPQLRPFEQVDKLQFEDQFFEYESNLRLLKNQIDSLKSIVTAFEKKQTMPNVSREILDLIKVPEFQYRIELKNGTVGSRWCKWMFKYS